MCHVLPYGKPASHQGSCENYRCKQCLSSSLCHTFSITAFLCLLLTVLWLLSYCSSSLFSNTISSFYLKQHLCFHPSSSLSWYSVHTNAQLCSYLLSSVSSLRFDHCEKIICLYWFLQHQASSTAFLPVPIDTIDSTWLCNIFLTVINYIFPQIAWVDTC